MEYYIIHLEQDWNTQSVPKEEKKAIKTARSCKEQNETIQIVTLIDLEKMFINIKNIPQRSNEKI